MRSFVPIAKRAPIRAPGTDPTVRTAKIAQSMCPSAVCTIVPGTTRATIASRDVPRARFSGIARTPANIGTMMRPPPMPSSPLIRPAPAPMPA